jgi:hypothetical protein
MPEGVREWLLEADNPPVRYLTLRHLLGRSPDSPQVRQAATRCGEYGPTQAILEQIDEFRNDDKEAAYRKYTGRYWQIIFLGQFRADGRDPRIRALVEGLISARDWTLMPGGGHCLTANLLCALNLLGFTDHPLVKEATVALADRLLGDGGIACRVMDYSLLPHCYMAQPKLLMSFASAGAVREHPSVARAMAQISANMVANDVFVYVPGNRKGWQEVLARNPGKAALSGGKRSGSGPSGVKGWVAEQKKRFLSEQGLGTRVPKPGWLRLGFPLHYNSDLLEALYALSLCGVRADARLVRPLEELARKMTPDGRCVLETTFNGKMRADVEVAGEPSKWLTYRAWFALQHLGG